MNMGDWELRGGGLEYFYQAHRCVLEYDRHIAEVLAGRVVYVERWLRVPYELMRIVAAEDGWWLPEVELDEYCWHPLKRLLTAYKVQGKLNNVYVLRAYEELRDRYVGRVAEAETPRRRKLSKAPSLLACDTSQRVASGTRCKG